MSGPEAAPLPLQAEHHAQERRQSLGLSPSHGLTLLGLMVASVVIRWPLFDVPMINDEGGYAYVAHFWSTDYQLYRDIPFYRPQAIFYVYKLILASVGESVVAIRLAAALVNAGTVAAVFWTTRALCSDRAALASASLFALFSMGPSMEGFTANAEVFTQLPLVLAAGFAWRRCWAAAGFLAGVAVLLKPSGVSVFFLALVWSFMAGGGFRAAMRVAIAFGMALLPSLAHGALIGWEHYWESMVRRRAAFATQGALSLQTQASRFAHALIMTSPSWGVPAVLSAFTVSRGIGKPQLFGLIWLVCSFMGMALGGFWFWHYFIQLLPPLAVLAGLGIAQLPRTNQRWFWSVPLAFAISLFVVRDGRIWSATSAEASWYLYGRSGYLVGAEVSEYVRSETSPADNIFIAFSQAEIYYLAKRKASFPHMYYDDFRYSERLFNEAIRSIREREPTIVVVAQPPPPNRMGLEEFLTILSEGYEESLSLQPFPHDSEPVLVFRRRTDT